MAWSRELLNEVMKNPVLLQVSEIWLTSDRQTFHQDPQFYVGFITDFREVKLSEVPPLEPVGSIGNVTGHGRLSITNHCPWSGRRQREHVIDLSTYFHCKQEAKLGSGGEGEKADAEG